MSAAILRPGFTLIELLVVVSIIAVLAAMLLPAIGLVRDASMVSNCQSNLRQLGVTAMVYAGDNDGFILRADGGTAAGSHSWDQVMVDDYESTYALMYCRADKDYRHAGWEKSNGFKPRSYGLAFSVSSPPLSILDPNRPGGNPLSQIPRQTMVALFAETIGKDPSWPWKNVCTDRSVAHIWDDNGVMMCHRKPRANVCFVDGHTKFIPLAPPGLSGLAKYQATWRFDQPFASTTPADDRF